MDFLDLIIVAILLLNVGLGWAFGLVRRIVAFAGLFAGGLVLKNETGLPALGERTIERINNACSEGLKAEP